MITDDSLHIAHTIVRDHELAADPMITKL